MIFPFPCTRCGFCCLSSTCPVAQEYFLIGKYDECPALSFDGDVATCRLVTILGAEMLGTGIGCCIKARAYKNGVEYDFASLPPILKIVAVRQRREHGAFSKEEAQTSGNQS